MAIGSSPVTAQDPPKLGPGANLLSQEVVTAWRNAGAEAGFMWDGPLKLFFQPKGPPEGPVGHPPVLPAFRFGDGWREGRLAKLPDPAIPFGLSFLNMTDTGLKDLAGMTSLQMLDLRSTLVTNAGLKELAPLKHLQSLM